MALEAPAQGEPNTPVGIDLTEEKNGGVIKEILREGHGDEFPSKGDQVTVHYVGTLTDGSKFDSSRDRNEKFTFGLGKSQVIKAWDLGVATMRKGEIARLTAKPDYAYGESGSPPKIPPSATLIFEVELFSWKGEDVSTAKDGGIIRSILHEGSGYSNPNDYAKVTVKYSLKCNDQTVVDGVSASFTLGETEDEAITSGLEMAIKKMKLKEKSRFTVAPKYAFGAVGSKSLNIPADATVVYEVELESFEKSKPAYEINNDEKIEQSQIRKAKGTEFFKKGMIEKAIANYNTILDYLDGETTLSGEQKEKRDALILAARLNLAACELKQDNNSEVIKHCNEALEIEANNTKAFFRRGQAHQKRKDYELAIGDFNKVAELEPENKAAKNQIILCRKELQAAYQKEKKLYANMFSKLSKPDSKVGEES